MAREVNATLGKIVAVERGLTEAQGEEVVKKLRNSNLYQVCSVPFFDFEGRVRPGEHGAEMQRPRKWLHRIPPGYLLFLRCTMEG